MRLTYRESTVTSAGGWPEENFTLAARPLFCCAEMHRHFETIFFFLTHSTETGNEPALALRQTIFLPGDECASCYVVMAFCPFCGARVTLTKAAETEAVA
jgi:hypothetical protein